MTYGLTKVSHLVGLLATYTLEIVAQISAVVTVGAQLTFNACATLATVDISVVSRPRTNLLKLR